RCQSRRCALGLACNDNCRRGRIKRRALAHCAAHSALGRVACGAAVSRLCRLRALLCLRATWRTTRMRLLRPAHCQSTRRRNRKAQSYPARARVVGSLRLSARVGWQPFVITHAVNRIINSTEDAMATLSFWGGVGTVTGSKYLLES